MLGWILRRVAHPAVNLATGFLTQAAELNRLQWESSREMENRILKRLRHVVAYACGHFRYYRDSLDSAGVRPEDIRTFRDFRRIRVITKADVAKYIEEEGVLRGRSGRLTSTGATSGRPLTLLIGREASIAGLASKVFFDSWLDVKPHDRKFSAWSHQASIRDRLFLNELEATSYGDILKRPKETYNRLSRFKPQLVGGGAGLRVLASFMIQNDWKVGGRLRSVVAWGMPLLPDQIDILSRAFSEDIYDRYGSAELSSVVAQQCQARTALHVNTELCHIEIVKDGEPCSDGERGKVVVTNLRNLATPFIRYDQEDTAVWVSDCACGRRLPLIAEIRGKDPSCVETKSGVQIPNSILYSFVGHLKESRYVERFSFRKRSADNLVLTILPRPGFRPQAAENIERKLAETLGSLASVSVEVEWNK